MATDRSRFTTLVVGPLPESFSSTSRVLYEDIALNRIGSLNGGKTINFLALNETSDNVQDNYGMAGCVTNTDPLGLKHLICGTTGEASHKGATASSLYVVGTAGVARFDGAGNGLAAIAILASPNLKTSTGAPVNCFGVYIDTQTIGSSGNFGLVINDMGAGRAIQTGTGLCYFGDTILAHGGMVIDNPLVVYGYTTGAGGSVVQGTSKSTGVLLNKPAGYVTMNAAALAGGAKVPFTITNSLVTPIAGPIVWVASGGTAKSYRAEVSGVGSGSFDVTVENTTAGSLSEAVVIGFAITNGAVN